MAKKSNRESVTIGHLATKSRPSVSIPRNALAAGRPTEPEFSAHEARPPGAKLGELIERETAAANACMDAKERALDEHGYGRPCCLASIVPPHYHAIGCRSADPGSVVGLDGLTPDSDTATDGDTPRTDPDPS